MRKIILVYYLLMLNCVNYSLAYAVENLSDVQPLEISIKPNFSWMSENRIVATNNNDPLMKNHPVIDNLNPSIYAWNEYTLLNQPTNLAIVRENSNPYGNNSYNIDSKICDIDLTKLYITKTSKAGENINYKIDSQDIQHIDIYVEYSKGVGYWCNIYIKPFAENKFYQDKLTSDKNYNNPLVR